MTLAECDALQADLLVATCKRLRELGATSFEGFGCKVTFERVVAEPAKVEKAEDPRKLSPEAEEVRQRALRLSGNGG